MWSIVAIQFALAILLLHKDFDQFGGILFAALMMSIFPIGLGLISICSKGEGIFSNSARKTFVIFSLLNIVWFTAMGYSVIKKGPMGEGMIGMLLLPGYHLFMTFAIFLVTLAFYFIKEKLH